MGRLQHEVALVVDDETLALGIAAPEHKHQMLALAVEAADDGVGKRFPPAALMRTGTVGLHRQGGVEQQHALLGPAAQTAALGSGPPEVVLDFLENILQRRGLRHAVGHRETEALGLPRLMVGVLPDDDHLDAAERAQVEGVEYLRAGRVTRAGTVSSAHKVGERGKIGLVELRLQLLPPAFFNIDFHLDS